MKLFGKPDQTQKQAETAADREIRANQSLAGCCGNLVTYHSYNWYTLLNPATGTIVSRRPVLLFDYVSGGTLYQYVNAKQGYEGLTEATARFIFK